MSKLLAALFVGLVSGTALYAEPQISQEYNFLGGLNTSQLPININDNQSPDMCNCISDPLGAATVRRGTNRIFSQAVSSYPVTSLYKVYSETSTEKALLFTNKNSIYYTTGGINPLVFKSTDALREYDGFNWLEMNNKAILLGGYDNDIIEVDPINKHAGKLFASTSVPLGNVYIRAKYGVMSKNYLLLANVKVSSSPLFETHLSTIYPSRVYFSDLGGRSSFTAFNFINFATGDGEEITGAGKLYDVVNFFKPSKILELSFSLLNYGPSGDVSVSEIVNDFGLRAPKSLVGARLYYMFAADDGIRIWNGSRTSRLTPSDESRVISGEIDSIIKSLVSGGTYLRSQMTYYPKREWLLFSYEDPDKFPRGVNNSILAYDFAVGGWFPFCGLNPQSSVVLNGSDDTGEILFGDNDGYVFEFDNKIHANDMRKELVVDVLDSSVTWVGSSQDLVNVKTGTSALKINVTASVTQSSMTKITTLNFGEWPDKKKITRDEKLRFCAYVDGLANLTSLRIDLEVNDVSGSFDNNFTSVTLTSASFISGNLGWTVFEIPLSSFPIRNDWVDFDSEILPFANTLFYYGVRFVLNGVESSTVTIDDLRIVQATNENPINFYRFTKLFDLQTKIEKNFGSALLTLEKPPTTDLKIDVYNNFGQKTRTESLPSELPKEIFIVGYSTGVIAALDSTDFTVKRTSSVSDFFYQYFQGSLDSKNIWLSDRINNHVKKLDRNTFVQVSTIGSFGSGATNFNLIHQTSLNETDLFVVDLVNQKMKQYNTLKNHFVREVGGLGTSTNTATPKFHQPTAIAANDRSVFIGDEGNYRYMRLNVSTFGFESQAFVDYNTIGETSFSLDEKYLYVCYNRGVENSLTDSEIILEKRDINNFELINRITVLPKNVTAGAPYGHTGDIALLGNYIYLIFNDDKVNFFEATHYIQKRLKSDFSLVKEMAYPGQRMFSVLGDGHAFKPSIKTTPFSLRSDGRYLQLKFYGESLDNDLTLYEIAFLVDPKSQGY